MLTRAREVLRWQLACGVQHVRTHVDVCDPDLRALRALVELREEARGLVDLQIVAFPQQGIFAYEDGAALMRKAVALGADVVGGIPHYELTREDGVESVLFSFALAEEHGLRVDIHCDETDDDHSRFVEVMVAETIRARCRAASPRATPPRCTPTSRLRLPAGRQHLAGRSARGDQPAGQRGAAGQVRHRADPSRSYARQAAAGRRVNVAIGHDSVMDPWYPLGYGDPLQAAFVLAHLGHMSGAAEIDTLLEMITTAPAAVLGVESHALEPGSPADLVVFDAPTFPDALRLVSPRHLVLRAGRVLARTAPAQTTVSWHGDEQSITFLRPQRRGAETC